MRDFCITTHQPTHHHPIAHHHPVVKDVFQDSARLITQSRKRQSPQSARSALLRRRARQAEMNSPLPIPCGPGASKIQVESYQSSPCGTPCTVHSEPGRGTRFLHPPGQMQAVTTSNKVMTRIPEPQDCRHPEAETSRKTAGARPSPDETSRKTAGARDDPTRGTIHPHSHPFFDKRDYLRGTSFHAARSGVLPGFLWEY